MVLLITGCIAPSARVNDLALRDAAGRLKEYAESIEFYISNSDFHKIVFCDNSNYEAADDIKEALFRRAGQYGTRLEWLSFQGDIEKTVQRGKGYGEGEIISFALENSRLLKEEKAFCKVTGRVKVLNINKILRRLKEGRNYFLNVNWKWYKHMIDTKFYVCRADDYKKWLDCAGEYVDDPGGIYLEHIFYKILRSNHVPYTCFPVFPEFCGSSASMGVTYASKTALRHFLYIIYYKILYVIQSCRRLG